MEIFRSVGLQREIESASVREFVQNGAIVAVESLGGPELKFFFRNFDEGVEALSPASRLFIADLRELIGDRNLSVVYVSHPELLGFFRFSITGDSGFLAVFSTVNPGRH